MSRHGSAQQLGPWPCFMSQTLQTTWILLSSDWKVTQFYKTLYWIMLNAREMVSLRLYLQWWAMSQNSPFTFLSLKWALQLFAVFALSSLGTSVQSQDISLLPNKTTAEWELFPISQPRGSPRGPHGVQFLCRHETHTDTGAVNCIS